MHVRSLTYRCSGSRPPPGRPDRASHSEARPRRIQRCRTGNRWGSNSPQTAPHPRDTSPGPTRHKQGYLPPAPPGTSHTLIDVYYLSHAFPLHTNHQQRKPTRPPTTTTAATEMPAIAPVERLGPLLVATHAEEPALGVKPALHVQTCFP